jgi:hypothetical protein
LGGANRDGFVAAGNFTTLVKNLGKRVNRRVIAYGGGMVAGGVCQDNERITSMSVPDQLTQAASIAKEKGAINSRRGNYSRGTAMHDAVLGLFRPFGKILIASAFAPSRILRRCGWTFRLV